MTNGERRKRCAARSLARPPAFLLLACPREIFVFRPDEAAKKKRLTGCCKTLKGGGNTKKKNWRQSKQASERASEIGPAASQYDEDDMNFGAG